MAKNKKMKTQESQVPHPILSSFQEATDYAVTELKRRGFMASQKDVYTERECSVCGFIARPVDKYEGKPLMWVSVVDERLSVLCQRHSYEERNRLRNEAKKQLMAGNPGLENKEAWERSAHVVGITGLTLLQVLNASKELANPELEKLLAEKVPCAISQLSGKPEDVRLIRRSQGCVLHRDAILAISKTFGQGSPEWNLVLLIHEKITGKNQENGEMPPFVSIASAKKLANMLDANNMPMIPDWDGIPYRPRLYTTGAEVVKKFLDGDYQEVVDDTEGNFLARLMETAPEPLTVTVAEITRDYLRNSLSLQTGGARRKSFTNKGRRRDHDDSEG